MADSAAPDGAPEAIAPDANPTPPSISAAAAAYQAAMEQPSATPADVASPAVLPNNMTRDVEMSDRTPDRVPASTSFNFTQISPTNIP